MGRGGDFFTSVSTGPLFGRLLAEHIAAWYREAAMPPRWRIIELGANDGTLAFANPAAEELLGLRSREWLGKPVLARLDEIAPGLGEVIDLVAREL